MGASLALLPGLCGYLSLGFQKFNVNTGLIAKGLNNNAQVADVDGDGFEDILFTENNKIYAYMNLGMNGIQHQGFSSQTVVGSLTSESTFPPMDGQPESVINSANLSNSIFFDMNGDGYTDILLKVTEYECINPTPTGNGECFEGYHAVGRTDIYMYDTGDGEYERLGSLGSIKNLRLGDLNGDGLTDLVFNNGSGWRYRLSNGRYFMPSVAMNIPDNAGERATLQLVDLDADGKSDIVVPEGSSGWGVFIPKPSTNTSNIHFFKRATIDRVSGVPYRFADLNGDGVPEMLYAGNGNYWHVKENLLGTPARNSIKEFTVGQGVRTRIHYSTLGNPNIYERSNSSQRDNGEFAMYTGYSVVGTVEREVQQDTFTQVRYRYGGLLVSRQGRGLLGFEFLASEDMTTRIATQTRYSQEFPFIGMPLSSETRDMDGNFRLSYSTNTLSERTNGPARTRYPYVSQSKEYSYAVQRNLNGTISGSVPERAVFSVFNQDVYGNLISSAVTTAGFGSTGGLLSDRTVVSTQNSYLSTNGLFFVGSASKRHGRLSASTVTTSLTQQGSTQSTSRSATFGYQSNGLLSSETTNYSGSNESLTVNYSYDAAGNIIQESRVGTQDGVTLPARVTKNTYDANRYRVTKRENAEGLVTSVAYQISNGHTVKMTSTGPNSEKSNTYFDTFGREYKTTVSFGGGSEIIQQQQQWTACGSCSTSNAVYKLTTTGSGKPTQWAYVDMFGRKVRTETKLLNGQVSNARTLYDNLGRVSKVYEPSTSSGSANVQYFYDRHGGVFKTKAPNGGYTNVALSGLSTVQNDAKGNTTTSIRDYAGRVVEVIDAANNSLLYRFHPSGQIAEVRSKVGSTQISRISNTYDADGRKIAMNDIEKGTWTYKYNGFGELFEQQDANSTIVQMTYDRLGRKTRQLTQDASSRGGAAITVCNKYESASSSAENAKGRLTETALFSGVRSCPTTATPAVRERYAYNAQSQRSKKTVYNRGQSAVFDYTYDSSLRPRLTRYPNNSVLSRLEVEHVYANGHLKGYRNTATGVFIEQVTEVNARGQRTRVAYQNGAETLYSYQSATGWLSGMTVNHSGVIRSINYGYDVVGNLTYREQSFRQGTGSNTTETFYYDELYRLTDYTQDIGGDSGGGDPGGGGDNPCPPGFVCGGPVEPPPIDDPFQRFATYSTEGSGSISHSYTYDAYGNFVTKSDVGSNGATYTYGASTPTRLTRVDSSLGRRNFSYYQDGSVRNDGIQTFIYKYFDKPTEVRRSNEFRTFFRYGPNRELTYQQNIRPSGTETRWMFGAYERVAQENGDDEHRFVVGNSVVTHTNHSSGTTEQISHLHKDGQGSTVTITGNAVFGDVLKQQFSYDPWGKQATLWSQGQFVFSLYLGDMRGYTGHTMVNDLDLIHMGGRTYNPVLGRFMQADPFIQAGTDLQNYNRYSYVLNNPLSYTDPSGYFFKKINNMLGDLAPVVGLAMMIIPGTQPLGTTMLNGFFAGGIATGNLRGAIVGAMSAGTAWHAGAAGLGVGSKFVIGSFMGGMGAAAQGGRFEHGFISASIGQLGGNTGNTGLDVIVAGVLGGTASKLVGGKFANGAVTGGFSAILASVSSNRINAVGSSQKATRTPSDDFESRVAAFELVIEKLYETGDLSEGILYRTPELAATAVLDKVTSHSKFYTLEVGGNIIEVILPSGGSAYSYTRPEIGQQNFVAVNGRAIGYHTHPSGYLVFSNLYEFSRGKPSDTHWIKTNKQDLYLGVMEGSSVGVAVCGFQSDCMRGFEMGGTPGVRVQ